jgi:hypothetical protein
VRSLVNGLLGDGCDVVLISMPFSGDNQLNSIPGVNRKPGGASYLHAHNEVGRLETISWTPIFYFIEPVFRAINHASSLRDYDVVAMAGKSGGGWSTTVAAAFDPRIAHSYAIAGTMPMYLRRITTSDLGDWEQSGSSLWSRVDYLDLYLMGALEAGRTADLMWLQHDSCCFQGGRAYGFMPQLIGFASRMGIAGLSFFVEPNTSMQHAVTPTFVDRVLGDLRERRRRSPNTRRQ